MLYRHDICPLEFANISYILDEVVGLETLIINIASQRRRRFHHIIDNEYY